MLVVVSVIDCLMFQQDSLPAWLDSGHTQTDCLCHLSDSFVSTFLRASLKSTCSRELVAQTKLAWGVPIGWGGGRGSAESAKK